MENKFGLMMIGLIMYKGFKGFKYLRFIMYKIGDAT